MNNEVEVQNNSEILTDKEIFTKIWTRPRQVFRFIDDYKYDKFVRVLLLLIGISRGFDRATMNDMGDEMSLGAIIGFSVVFGGLLGWISIYLYAALLSWTGKWLGGKGNTTSILRILSYAMIPSILALLFLIPQIGIYGIEMFKEYGDISSAGVFSNIFVYGSLILEFILGIWMLVLCVIALSEAQKISIGMAILNIVLPALVIGIPIFLIVYMLM